MLAPEPASAESTPANAGAEIESSPNRQGRPGPDRTPVTNEGGSEPTKARQRRPRSRVAPSPSEPSSTPTAEALSRAGWTHRERRSTRTGSSDHYRLQLSIGSQIPEVTISDTCADNGALFRRTR